MITPQYKGARIGYWNKAEWGLGWISEKQYKSFPDVNPLLKAENSQKLVDQAKRELSCDILYGGWMEDRTHLWNGSYLSEEWKFLHLGQDIWVSAGTEIAVDRPGTVVYIGNDTPLVGGWGTHVHIKLKDEDFVLLYGHLAPSVLPKLGDRVGPGDVIARVGTSAQNGAWASHVHIQAIEGTDYRYFETHMDDLDGYGRIQDRATLARKYPDPLQFIELC